MARILKVCTSEFLPPLSERDSNYVYFVYDKMAVYLGQVYYSDPFCVVEEMPTRPVEGMLYITIDGKLKTYHNYNVVELGDIESPSQLPLLIEAGTQYFMKAEYRYLDLQTRTIELPFQNGSYQLSVNLAKNIQIDSNTVIRYNPASGKFEISGSEYGKNLNKSEAIKELKGGETDTTSTVIIGGNIRVNVKISPEEGNLIKSLDSGLYASLDEFLTDDDLQTIKNSVAYYESTLNKYLTDLQKAVDDTGISVSESSIIYRIKEEMDRYYPTIQEALAKYEEIYQNLEAFKADHKTYTDTKFEETRKKIADFIDQRLAEQHPWVEDHAYLRSCPGTYRRDCYGGTSCKFYEANENEAEFAPGASLMREVYVVNNGNKVEYVRVHIAVPKVMLNVDEEQFYDPSVNFVSIGVSTSSLNTGAWNWSTNIGRDSGAYAGPVGILNTYDTTIDEVEHTVFVLTYETALAPNQKTLSAMRNIQMHGGLQAIDMAHINAVIQDDHWEFPMVVESVPSSTNTDIFAAFESVIGIIGNYDPFNPDFHED